MCSNVVIILNTFPKIIVGEVAFYSEAVSVPSSILRLAVAKFPNIDAIVLLPTLAN